MPTLEDLMGLILFGLGFVLMTYGILALLAVVSVPAGASSGIIIGFIVFGFVLCVVGFLMARSASRRRI